MRLVSLCLLLLVACDRSDTRGSSRLTSPSEGLPAQADRVDASSLLALDATATDAAGDAPPDRTAPTTEAALTPGELVNLPPIAPHGRRRSAQRVPPFLLALGFTERIARRERATQFADDGGVRYALVESRCNDLVPRGGSDCIELGFNFREMSLRAVALPDGRRLWSRRVSIAPPASSARLSVRGDALVLSYGGSTYRFRTRDGARWP